MTLPSKWVGGVVLQEGDTTIVFIFFFQAEDGIRDLTVTGVQTCALPISRVISDAGFGDFIRMLEYKCKWYGRTLVKVDTFFPSSKLCCICHVKNVELKLQDRWQCPNCQTDHQRDENAVVNLFVEGLRILAEGRSVIVCGDTVRLERKPKHMSAKQETSLETCGNVA